MPYSDFTIENVEAILGLTLRPGALFPDLKELPVPAWLSDLLARAMRLSLASEKARSEFVVAPVLLASRELSGDRFAILSGQNLDVDPERGLVGECDFILARAEPLPLLRAPVVTIVEAKKNDIDLGLGQCLAQMVAAALFNERSHEAIPRVFGCVTTGENWQFLRLEKQLATIDPHRLYIDNVGAILAALKAMVEQAGGGGA